MDDLLGHFRRQVSLPWPQDTPPDYRVWIMHYDRALERRVLGRLHEFESLARQFNHSWVSLSLASLVAPWFAQHELFEGLIGQPRRTPRAAARLRGARRRRGTRSASVPTRTRHFGPLWRRCAVRSDAGLDTDREGGPGHQGQTAAALSWPTREWRLPAARRARRLDVSRNTHSGITNQRTQEDRVRNRRAQS